MQVKDDQEDVQAERLAQLVGGLFRRFRLYDRDEKCCHGVTIAQCALLEELGGGETLRMQELAGRLGVAQSTVTRVLAPLERRKLVSRAADPLDRRAMRVRLTPAGRALLDRLRSCSRELFRAVLRALPESGRDACLGGLEQLAAALTRACAECCR